MHPLQAWDPWTTHRAVGTTTNLRDLGGIPAGGGAVVAPGRLFRAEALVSPGTTDLCAVHDPADDDAYAALGVRTVIDLRSAGEVVRIASRWPDATGAVRVGQPMEGAEGDTDVVGDIRAGRRHRFTAADLADLYTGMLATRAAEIGAALRVLADPARLPALVHCAAGKDRTGVVVALLLELLGVPREVVVAEYAFTGVLRPDRVRAYAPLFAGSGVDLAAVAPLFDTPAESIETALARLDSTSGSVAGYLEGACGLSRTEQASIRENLLVTPS